MSKRPNRIDLQSIISGQIPAAQASFAGEVTNPETALEPEQASPAQVEAQAPARSDVVDLSSKRRPTQKTATTPEGQGTLKERAKQMALYLEPPVYEELRQIAFAERKKIHGLVMEGIELLLKKKGSPPIPELLKNPKKL